MLHILKLAVGIRDPAHLAEIQQARLKSNPPLRHQTRNTPKRAEEVTAGGSIYWVIGGVVLVRQRITAIIRDSWDDGSACAGLVLDPELVRVTARAMKPFQGWRYLQPADAPPDLATGEAAAGQAAAGGAAAGKASDIDALPDQMRAALTALALL